MNNSLWKKILHVYFGTPIKASISTIIIVSQVVFLAYYFYQSRIEKYGMLLEKTKHEQMLLKNFVAEIREKQPFSISFNFRELKFKESIEKENENQVRRLLEYGQFALTKNNYDYAK